IEALLKGIYSSNVVSKVNDDNEFVDANKITLNVLKNKLVAESNGKYIVSYAPITDKYIDELEYDCINPGKITVNALELIAVLEAFPPNEKVKFKYNNGELLIQSSFDKEREQSVSIMSEDVELPMIAPEYNKITKVDRETFIKGVKKVKFAMGFARTNRKYMCLIMQAIGDKLRFMAGSGGRFAIDDIYGDTVVQKTKDETYVFPRESIDAIEKILSKASCDYVTIKEAPENINNKQNPAQIVIEYDEQLLVLVGLNTAGKPQEVDKFLNATYENTIATRAQDWQYIVKGIKASDTYEYRDSHDIHNTRIENDKQNNKILVKTLTKKLCKAKITVEVKEDMKEGGYFHCNSIYIQEMINSCENKSEVITMKYDNYKEGEKSRPVLVEYEDIVNRSKNTIEKFKLLFAMSVE
ncbi:MAG: hypothetical protein ACOCP8_07755, partial [archaeon]